MTLPTLSRALLCAATAISIAQAAETPGAPTNNDDRVVSASSVTAGATRSVLTVNRLDNLMVKDVATKLQDQFKGVPGFSSINFNTLLSTVYHYVPAGVEQQRFVASLVMVRLVMSTTKAFDAQNSLTDMLKERLVQCGFDQAATNDFVTQQGDLISGLWTDYQANKTSSDKTWIIPYVSQELNILASTPGVNSTAQKIFQIAGDSMMFVPLLAVVATGGSGGCCGGSATKTSTPNQPVQQ